MPFGNSKSSKALLVRSASVWWFLCALVGVGDAQVLRLPPRPVDAPSGSAFIQSITNLPLIERETRIEAEILRGNVPDFLRRLKSVTLRSSTTNGPTNVVELFVTPDYLSIGSDSDYFLTPMTPQTAQRIAEATACTLPTARVVDAIHAAADVKLVPGPLAPNAAMTRVEVFARHNDMVRTQRSDRLATWPLGALVAGHKKDVVMSNRLTNAPGKVAIYGWHQTNGKPIQPLYVGHADTWVDYSHGIRLVDGAVNLNGEPRSFAQMLADPQRAALLTGDGPSRNLGNSTERGRPANASSRPVIPATLKWLTNALFAERSATFPLLADVRVQCNEPLSMPTNRPILLTLYTLPNGNTIEQTAGRKLAPDDDWHFDIQHIAAQMRFLRAADTNQIRVIAYLEAGQKSWPAWRKAHAGDSSAIPKIVGQLAEYYPHRIVRIALSGHSGGGSFIFGYLNAVKTIPDPIERIAFLDATYAYEPALGHTEKLADWLKRSEHHCLSVLAYNDAVALLDGKPFVSATGGTWYRSHLMLTNLTTHFSFGTRTNAGLTTAAALANRVQFLLKENPDRKILHTVQVERNGFIQSMVSGTRQEGIGYEYFGPRAYESWIDPAPAR